MRHVAATSLALLLLLLLCCAHDISKPYENPAVQKSIIDTIPRGWRLVEVVPDQLPRGHNRSGAAKHGGIKLIFVGPQDVEFAWRDSSGVWHGEALAKESLELWIMPPSYRDNLLDVLDFNRPTPAPLIHDGPSVRVYAQPGHRIISEKRGHELLQQATETNWPRSPYNGATPLSWSSWQADLKRALTAQPTA